MRKENNENGLKWGLKDGRNKNEREKTSNMDVERQEERSGWTGED